VDTREDRLRTIDQTAHCGAARLIPVHIKELPSPRKASAHRRGPPRTARPNPPFAYSGDGGFQLPGDEQAAYAAVVWLQRADMRGSLGSYFNPPLTPEEREVAAVKGWMLGVV
jgi:hypothetical protein